MLTVVKALWPSNAKAGCFPSKPASVAQIGTHMDDGPPTRAETRNVVNYLDEAMPPTPTFERKRYRIWNQDMDLATKLKFQKQSSFVSCQPTCRIQKFLRIGKGIS